MPSSEGPTADSRLVDESRAVLTTTVLPADTNSYGNLFGGALVALIDKVASITAFRHARRNVVTASIDALEFHEPVRLGDILTLQSWLNYVGRSSMEIEVDVTSEDRLSGAKTLACSAYLTFVAVGDEGRPTEVPRLEFVNEEQESRFESGARRALERRRAKTGS